MSRISSSYRRVLHLAQFGVVLSKLDVTKCKARDVALDYDEKTIIVLCNKALLPKYYV